jgi:uncharacterized membrane protein
MTKSSLLRASRTRIIFCVIPLTLAFLVAFAFSPETSYAKTARYTSFDVSLTLQEDGTIHVVETQNVRFDGGTFSTGHRTIPLERTGGIENVHVYELVGTRTVPYTEVELATLTSETNVFSAFSGQESISIYWTYEPTSDEDRKFVVEYDVLDALRVYQDESPPNEQLWWSAFGSDLTEETDVDASLVTITLPEAVNVNEVVLSENDDPDEASTHTINGQIYTWSREGFSSGDDFTVRLQFPVIVDVDAPSWQAADDKERANAELDEKHDAEMTVVLLAAGLALATGGGIGAYGVWYTRGRDPFVGLAADFLPAPPSDLPAAVAGTLLDERADEHDVVAIIFDLGNRGVLKVTDVGLLGPLKRRTNHDYILEVVDPDISMNRAEKAVLSAVFGSVSPKAGEKTSLKDAGPRILERAQTIKDALYAELVERGFFNRSPEEARDGWRKVGILLEIVAIVFGVTGVVAFNWMALFPAAVILVLGLVVIRMSRAMPRKTAKGSEEAAKWRAFCRYLEDLDKYDQLTESSKIIERYLSYAIAFECEQVWLTRYRDSGFFTFDWLEVFGRDSDRPYQPASYDLGRGVGDLHGGLPDLNMPNVDLPDIQNVSTKSAAGLQKGSSDLSDALNVVGAILEVVSAFSGGGGSGGSSGGGGGGFD